MQIGTRLKVIAVLPVLLGLAVATILTWTNRAVDRSVDNGRIADVISRGAFELALLSYDPSLRQGNPRVLEQWQSRRVSIDSRLASFESESGDVAALISSLRDSLARMDTAFDLIVASVTERKSGTIPDTVFQERIDRAYGRIFVASQMAITDSLRLNTAQMNLIQTDLTRGNHWTIGLTLAISVIVSVGLLAIGRGIARPVSTLLEATEVIGQGDLSHRIDLNSGDELGSVAGALNRMSENLVAVMASRDDLNREIAERRRIENALRLSEGRFRTLIDASPAAIFLKDSEGRFEIVNTAFLDRWGLTEEDVIGKTAFGHLPPDKAREFTEENADVMASGKAREFEREILDRYGERRVIHAVLFPIINHAGEVVGTGGISTDITARKKAEERLRKDEERFRSYFLMGLVGIAETSPKRGWIRVNRHLCDMLGYEPKEFEALTWTELTHPEDLAKDVAEFERVLAGEIDGYAIDKRFIRKDGTTIDTMMSVRCQRLADGTPDYFIAFLQDIREVKAVQRQLARSNAALERSNQELQQFAYIASHDLREPLRMVGSYVQLLARRYKGKLDEDADEFIHFAVDGVGRMQRLLDGLLAFSRVRTHGQEFNDVDMNQVLAEASQDLEQAVLESGATITHDPLPSVSGDPGQLGRVFQNLITNAIKFRNEDPPQVHVSAERNGREWIFAVRDNGIGIEPQFCKKIFEIFKRLHARDEYPGEGLGLAITSRIIDRHGGRIWVESEPGKGAVFFFTIPDPEIQTWNH